METTQLIDEWAHQYQTWAAENLAILAEVFAWYEAKFEWPKVEDLERSLFQRGSDSAKIREALTTRPVLPYRMNLTTDYFKLYVRDMALIPAAMPLVNLVVTATQMAVASYKSTDEPPLIKSSNFNGNMAPVVRFRFFEKLPDILFAEPSSPFAGGNGGPDWIVFVNKTTAQYFDQVKDTATYLNAQETVFRTFFPTHQNTVVNSEVSDMPYENEPKLKISREEFVQALTIRIDLGDKILQAQPNSYGQALELEGEFKIWNDYNITYLRRQFTSPEVSDNYTTYFSTVGATASQVATSVRNHVRTQQQNLQSILARAELYDLVDQTSPTVAVSAPVKRGDGIFIVHGHDGDLKLQVARFVEQCVGIRPIILHEKADRGKTIIEKFEAHASDARFAIVLLTADDEGRPFGEEPLRLRARQNVVFEHGFFIGQLGRENVVALYEHDVDLPSDLAGVLYKSVDGNWHTSLATELEAAGFNVDLNKLT